MLSQLDLNLLVVLETVLAERSVAKAASRLHVTPSAVSNSLARLRQALSDPLVIKSGRGIVPTPRAAALAPVLARSLRELDQAIVGDTFDAATTTRQFTLAIADAGQVVQVPELAAELARKMPQARLRVVGLDFFLSSGGLGGTEVDVAILASAEKVPGVRLVPIYEEHSVLVARRGHPLAGASSERSLRGVRHVEVEVAPGRGYRELAAAYARQGIPREVALIVPTFAAAAAVVAGTDWVATLPASFVKRLGPSFGLSVLTTSAPRVSIAIKMAWHERTERDSSMRAFRELLANALRAGRRKAPPKHRTR